MSDPSYTDDLVLALQLAAHNDRAGALVVARESAAAGSLLGTALVQHLDTSTTDTLVYDSPAAFSAFIRGGGNVELYRSTSAHLAAVQQGVHSLLEIGPGDGLALLPALADSVHEVTLVEPSAELLQQCAAAVAAIRRRVEAHQAGIADFLADNPDRTWDLAESTFALQALEPDRRDAVLGELVYRVDTLTLVEFDVQLPPPGSAQHFRELALCYERGLAEYTDTRDLVAQGFLVPVLLGQLAPGAVRATWEQSAAQWQAQLERVGFTDVERRPIAPYWWSPAFALTARGRRVNPGREGDGPV